MCVDVHLTVHPWINGIPLLLRLGPSWFGRSVTNESALPSGRERRAGLSNGHGHVKIWPQ